MAIVKKTIDISSTLSDSQISMLKEAEFTPYVYDEDNPIMTYDEMKFFKRIKDNIQNERKKSQKQNITLRISPKTLQKAKLLGKGYSGVLSKIIEIAMDNPETLSFIMSNSDNDCT